MILILLYSIRPIQNYVNFADILAKIKFERAKYVAAGLGQRFRILFEFAILASSIQRIKKTSNLNHLDEYLQVPILLYIYHHQIIRIKYLVYKKICQRNWQKTCHGATYT